MALSISTGKKQSQAENYKMYSIVGKDGWVINACIATSLEDCKESFPGDNYLYIEMTEDVGPGYYPGFWDGKKFIRGDEYNVSTL